MTNWIDPINFAVAVGGRLQRVKPLRRFNTVLYQFTDF